MLGLGKKEKNEDASSTVSSSTVSQAGDRQLTRDIKTNEPPQQIQASDDEKPSGVSKENGQENSQASAGDEEEEEEGSYITGVPLYLIIFGLSLAILLVALDNAILATAIPTITARFNSLEDVGWYGSAYLLTTCALQPLAGKIFRFFSLKGSFLAFLAIFEIGSLICATAPSSAALIIGRAIAEAGSAGIFSGALTIIGHTIRPRMRPTYTGILVSMFGIAGITGPVLGGALTQHVFWRWCFYINLPTGAVTTLLLFFFFHPKSSSKSGAEDYPLLSKILNLDLPSLIFFIPAITFLLLALQWGGTKHPWKSGIIIGFFVASGVMFILFGIWESYQSEDRASIPGKLVRDRSILCAVICGFMVMGGMQVGIYYNPIYFQVVKGVSPTDSGIKILPMIMGSMTFNIICGILISKTGYFNHWMYLGFTIMAIGAGVMSTFGPDTPTAEWAGKLFLTGSGIGMIMQAPIIAVQNLVPPKLLASATAHVVAMQFLGGAISLTISQSVFASKLRNYLPRYAPTVPVGLVLSIGASDVHTMIKPESSVAGVILAYCKSIDNTYYVTVGMASAGLIASFGVRWVKIKGQKKDISKTTQNTGEKDEEAAVA